MGSTPYTVHNYVKREHVKGKCIRSDYFILTLLQQHSLLFVNTLIILKLKMIFGIHYCQCQDNDYYYH